MTTQGGGNNTQTQAEVHLKYVSEGYQKEIQNLQNLSALIAKIKEDLGSVSMPSIKGMKGALTDAKELSRAIELMVRTGNVAYNASEARKTQGTSLKQAELNAADRALKVQDQLAKEAQKTLQRDAFLGQLKAEEIKKHEKNIDNLKAISKGLEESAKAGKAQASLQRQVTELIKTEITQRKEDAQKLRTEELRKRLEANNVAKRYAREAVEGTLSKADLKSQLGKSDLPQLRAYEKALNAEKLKAGYVETPQVKEFSKQVSNRIKAETAPKVDLKASEIVKKIAAGNFTQAEVNHAVTQIRKQLTHATNTGADRKTLVGLHEGLIDVRKAAAKKFTPQSPYQVAKGLEETKAEQVLTNRLNATSVATATKAQIQEQLKASEVMGHKTKAPFGSPAYDQEKAYQELLKGRLQIIKQQEAEEKKKDALGVKGTIYRDSLGKIKSGDVLGGLEGLSLRQLKKLQTQLLSHLDLTGLDTKVKENFKRALVQIDGTLKSAKRGELNLLGLEAPDTSKPLKRDKQLNIFEKARQGQLSIKDLQDFQAGSTDPKRTLKELRAIQNQIRKAELDPNLITTTDKAPNRLGNFIRTQISGLNQTIADLEKASKPVKALKEKDWSTQTREAVRSDINTLGQSRDPIARQNIREEAKRNFETKQNQAEYNKELILHKASLNQATIQQMTTSTELAKATKAIQLDNKLHPKNQEANLALTEAIKQRTKDLNYQARLRDPNFKASEDLKQNQTNLRTTNVNSLLQGQDLSSARQVAKVNAELEKQRAIQAGIFDSKDKLLKLSPEEHKFAKATLNYQYAMNQNDKVKREEAARLLNVLSDIEKANRRATAANQNLANLAHKYTTTGEIRAIQDRAEAELARKVVAYRMRSTSYTEEELKHQQKLLDAAKSRDHLLTSQANRQDRERQHERRLTQLTHLEGDGGASMAIVQAGFMMRSQVLGGLSSIFSGAFDSAVQLDKAFRNLQAISASTNYEMATMKVNLINVAQASKFSASEVGETAVMLAQAGLSIQEIGASMKGIITLAQATGTDLAKSVDVVTSVLSIFNKSATETDTIVNQLTAALNESKLDINKMALGLQYAGNIANDSGVSFEELTAALGATANAGIRSGSTLGTGLRQMFIDLQKPNEKLTKRLETLGITLDQVSFRSQGLEGVLRNLRNAGFSSADAFETFEVRSAAAFSALSGNLTDFHDLQEELLDTNAAFEANNVQMESFAVQLDHLKSNLGILAAEGLGPVLSLLRDMTKGMAHAMQNAEEGTGVINLLTTAFVSLMTGVTLAWFARLVGGLATTTAALMGVGRALTLTRYAFIGILAAGVTFIASLVSQRNEVERLNTALDKTRGKYNDLKASLQSKESALDNVNDALKNLVDRYGVLKNDSSQTQAVTKSLQEQFNQFGLELDDVADNKIDNVINKVRDLRAELAKDLRQTIIEEAAAKIKLKGEEKRTAEASLKEADVGGAKLGFNRASFEQFLHYTSIPDSKLQMFSAGGKREVINGRGYVTDQQRALRDNPAVKSLFLELYRGAIRTQSEGNILPTKDFNPSQILLNLRNKVAEVKDAEAARLLTEAVDNLKAGLDNITTVIENPEKVRKINEKTNRDVRTIDLQEKFNDPRAMGGASEAQIAALNAKINTIGDIKGLSAKERRLRQSAAAKPVYEWFENNIASAEKQIEAMPSEFDRETFKNLMAAVQARKGEVRKILVDNDKQFRKEQLTLLTRQIKAAEEDVRFAEEQHKDSSGLITEEKTYVNLENKRKALNKLRFDKAEIESKDADNAEAHIAALRQEVEIEAKRNERERQKKIKAIKDNAKSAANTNLNTADKARLDAKKKDLEDFYKDIKNREKTLEGRQEAERFQATAKTYRPLTTGNMFDQLNTEDKKAAQAKANATGVSQEYSVLGKVKGTFSRQAARFDNESLQKKQVQEKLALETAILFDLQQRKQNLGIEEYNKLKAEQITLEAEVTRLNNIAADARADKHPEDLKLAEEALDRNKEAIQSHQEAEERLTQDIETRNNTIENLKNNLQALIDKYDLLDTTMSAGVQSMTSGLSSIFSDWASGVIQNTEDVRDAFEALGKSVLQSMAKVVSDRIAQQFMGFLLNGLGSMFGSSPASSAPLNFGEAIVGQVPVLSQGLALPSTGGLITTSGVKHFARGGEVTGTNIGRDSVPALLQPNEYVIQRSAVQALGTDFMQNLNNVTAGSLKQGAASLGGSKPMVQNVMKSSPPVNVYVVSPEQQRQMGQEDVVVALQDDILRGGTTKKLIKAVITGEI